MKWFPSFGFQRRKRELQEELDAHLQMAIADRVARGETAETARQAAAREFGNIPLVQDVTRDMWGQAWLEQPGRDVRYALRQLRKSPGFSITATAMLAEAICANSTVFSWIDGTMLRPIPGSRDTGDLVSLQRGERSFSPTPPFSYLDYRDLREQNHTFAGILAYHHDWITLTGGAQPERAYIANVSANYFDVLGIKPVLGRFFLAEEETRPDAVPNVVLGYSLWKTRYAEDPAIVGKSIEIARHPVTVSGALDPVDGFDNVAGRDAWFAGSAIVNGQRVGPPLGIRSVAANSNGSILFANVHVGGIPRSMDGGISWQPTIDINSDVHEVCGHHADPGIVVAAAAVGLCISRDSGSTWTIEREGLHAPHCSAVAISGDDILFSAAKDPFAVEGRIYRRPLKPDGRLTAVEGGMPAWTEGIVDTGCIAAKGSSIAVADRAGNLYRSDNFGRAWLLRSTRLPPASGVLIC